ncbi:truncated transcription factor CAULIFLOWER A-like isoform X2 [Juglans microcarpa x Juglans regia]|uniref:truncated transcription factor CAULIFLOWER A-like isoform X2 n=1 Tax=Juglans microcarpa x Juglans regia TaxID=2249226 RepID=UPI001B7DBB40|nr:truncated transcription factor CAULIFLOWER A-like isoform X2 [Juglans microcarpa x Juglans regia]
MGRGRVQLKRIENNIRRQVTFSKRRTGLLKKAHEISVLCDVELALIVFSTKGKLFEFSSNSSMERILERYERYSHAERSLVATHDSEPQGSCRYLDQVPRLFARNEVLQRNIRNFLGGDLDPLSIRELRNIEQQLDLGLKRIRTRKNKLIDESIMELQKKEKALQEQNKLLVKQLKENGKTVLSEHAHGREQPPPSTLALPPLTIGGTFQATAMDEDAGDQTQPRRTATTLMPPWMLHHVMNGYRDSSRATP